MTTKTTGGNRFSRTRQPVTCLNCGKLTTSPGQNTDLCGSCYEAAGLENEHVDGGHDGDKLPSCPLC